MKYLTLFLLLALSTCLWADEHDVPAPFDYGRVRIPPGGGSGEVNTASNQGAGGVGLYDTKVGVDIQFKNINAGSNQISVTNDGVNKEVDIDVNEANIKLDDLGTPDDNTDLNATTTYHGLLPKLDNDPAHYLDGQGGWTTPAGGGTMTHAEIEESLNVDIVEPSQNWYWQDDTIFVIRTASNDTTWITINADGELEFGPPGTAKADSLLISKWIQIVDSDIEFWKDGSNNLAMKDAITGTKTLAELAAGGGSDITVEDEATPLTAAVTKFNFAGAGVTATEPIADEILVTIPGGGGGSDIEVQDEGTPLTTAVTKFNFAGVGVTVTEPIADEMLVTIPGEFGASDVIIHNVLCGWGSTWITAASGASANQRFTMPATLPDSFVVDSIRAMCHTDQNDVYIDSIEFQIGTTRTGVSSSGYWGDGTNVGAGGSGYIGYSYEGITDLVFASDWRPIFKFYVETSGTAGNGRFLTVILYGHYK